MMMRPAGVLSFGRGLEFSVRVEVLFLVVLVLGVF